MYSYLTVVFHLYAVQLYAVFEENCEKLSSENFPVICRILDKIFILTEKLLSSYLKKLVILSCFFESLAVDGFSSFSTSGS